MAENKTITFPKSRIATNDVCAIGKQKHHITALIEVDVTESREKLKQYRSEKSRISFFAWLIKTITSSIKDFENVASYLKGKRKLIVFKDINVSVAVEKTIEGNKVPIPLVIEKANEKSMETITLQIRDAKEKNLTDKDIVLQKRSSRLERIYYLFPGFIRRYIWFYLIRHPHFAFNKMGNVAITSVGMLGKTSAWFVPISVHPICLGIGDIIKKPAVVNDEIEIREILHMSILLDHDVVDGMEMAKFVKKMVENIEKGIGLEL